MITNKEFTSTMFGPLPSGQHIAVTHFSNYTKPNWDAKFGNPLNTPDFPEENSYFCPSSLEGGKRKLSAFRSLFAVVLDDISPETLLELPKPTYVLETSAHNYQVGYKLLDPVTDLAVARALHNGLHKLGFCDDNGNNPVRWVRLPVGYNTKPDRDFRHHLEEWNPSMSYKLDELVSLLKIDMIPAAPERNREANFDPFDYIIAPRDERLLRDALLYIDPNPYDNWLKVGGALSRSGAVGEKLFIEWSSRGDNFTGKDDCKEKLYNLAVDTPSRFPVVFEMAKANGWETPSNEQHQQEEGSTKFRFMGLNELLDRNHAPVWIIKGLLEADTMTALAGPPKDGKSFIALDAMLHVAAGIPWAGLKVKQGPVFYIAGEGHGGLGRRIEGWFLLHPDVPRTIPFFVSNKAVALDASFDGETGAKKVAEIIHQMRKDHGEPVAIVIDTLSRNFSGEENSNTDMARFVSEVDKWLKLPSKAAILIVHHSTKDGGQLLRGASALRGALDGLIEVLKDGNPGHRGIRVSVITHFLKDGETPDAMLFDCKQVVIGLDDDLGEITTLVPKPMNAGEQGSSMDRNIQGTKLVTLLREMYAETNEPISKVDWMQAAIRRAIVTGTSDDAIRKLFDRRLRTIEDSKMVSTLAFGRSKCYLPTP